MPFVPVANTLLVEIRCSMELQNVENTLYFRSQDPWTVGTMNTLGEEIIDWWVANIAPRIWAGVTLREVALTDLTNATAPAVVVTPPGTTTGELAQDHLPNNVSLAISFRTALRGRSFRGRNYIFGFVESQVTGSQIVEATIDEFEVAYALLIPLAVALDAVWVVVSRFSGVDPVTGNPIPRANGVSTPIVSVTIVDSVVDSQRRRLPGRGV